MRTFLLVLVCLVGGIVAFALDTSVPTEGRRSGHYSDKLIVRLGTVPVIKLEHDITATSAQVAQIKQHIANLRKIAQPDFGLSSTMIGNAFAPIASSAHFDGGILIDHRIKTSDDVRSLVAFGPKALPFLLAALDDKTSTKLTLGKDNSIFTAMYFSNELDGNPTNSVEQKAIGSLPKRDWNGETMESYTVRVGDVCFAIIGQIVGRNYLAVRYQMSAIVIVNSPVHDAELAKQVRAVWSGTDAAQSLLDSLLLDYSTEIVSRGNALDSWQVGNGLQASAAMRLLYYFPHESAEMIAERLARLYDRENGDTNAVIQNSASDVSAEDFVKAVAWSDAPPVKSEVLNIFENTTNIDLLLAALPGIDSSNTNLIRTRLEGFINRLPAEPERPYGDGYNLLVALGQKLGDQAKPIFFQYLQNAGLQRWRTMAKVLQETQRQWAVELLLPALTDKRGFGWDYALVPGQNEPRRPIRVCDEAAETINMSRPDLKFVMAGEHVDLDRQIAVMRERIQQGK